MKLPNESQAITQQRLCVYRDEAIGAKPIPLMIVGESLWVKKSSEYFTGEGIVINLGLDSNLQIVHVDLGTDIRVDLKTIGRGLEIGPLGFLPIHVLQLGSGFDPATGGTLRFGYMKSIFCRKYFGLTIRNLFSRVKTDKNLLGQHNDLSLFWQSIYGEGNWGIYDIMVHRDFNGKWAVFVNPPVPGLEPVNELVAYFKVNRAGVALGIRDMVSL